MRVGNSRTGEKKFEERRKGGETVTKKNKEEEEIRGKRTLISLYV